LLVSPKKHLCLRLKLSGAYVGEESNFMLMASRVGYDVGNMSNRGIHLPLSPSVFSKNSSVRRRLGLIVLLLQESFAPFLKERATLFTDIFLLVPRVVDL
jgi:hypothetical protein